jgi:hypothetical protein
MLIGWLLVFVFTTLEPFLKPIMKTATAGLSSASGEVINNHDQYEVFNDPRAVSALWLRCSLTLIIQFFSLIPLIRS